MNNPTNLERAIIEVFKLNPQDLLKITQDDLDKKTKEIISLLTPDDLIAHTKSVYDRTAVDFEKNPHTESIIDELIMFISLLNKDDLVLDLGCGHGRDTLYMASNDMKLRRSLMQRENGYKEKTINKHSPPQIALRVVALDSSPAMLDITLKRLILNKATIKCFPILLEGDMHGLKDILPYYCFLPNKKLKTALQKKKARMIFKGIWSCASLLTHTPKELVEPAIKFWSNLLLPDGIFFLSYINGKITDGYDKLLISSSGNIKYFSHQNPDIIRDLAKKFGLKEIVLLSNDFSVNGKIIKEDFFVSQIFEKIRTA